MARYAGQLLAPAEGFVRDFFLPFGQKKVFFMMFLAHYWYSVVTLVTFRSNLSIFFIKKIQKTKKNPHNSKLKF